MKRIRLYRSILDIQLLALIHARTEAPSWSSKSGAYGIGAHGTLTAHQIMAIGRCISLPPPWRTNRQSVGSDLRTLNPVWQI